MFVNELGSQPSSLKPSSLSSEVGINIFVGCKDWRWAFVQGWPVPASITGRTVTPTLPLAHVVPCMLHTNLLLLPLNTAPPHSAASSRPPVDSEQRQAEDTKAVLWTSCDQTCFYLSWLRSVSKGLTCLCSGVFLCPLLFPAGFRVEGWLSGEASA